MKILFIASSLDPAGENLVDTLFRYIDFKRLSPSLYVARDREWFLKIVDIDITNTDYVDKDFEVDVNIFLSRHSSQAGLKTLSVHPTGNPNREAGLGGMPESLPPCHPLLMAETLKKLYMYSVEAGLDYLVTMEVTHHGPTELRNPSFFVEIGSSISEWTDVKAADIIINTILDVVESFSLGGYGSGGKIFVGFGGPHYAPRFTNAVLNKNYVVGHILSKYSVEKGVSQNIILDAFRKSMDAKYALIDWKGLKGRYRKDLLGLLEEYGLGYEKA